MQRSVILGHIRSRYGIPDDDGLLTATVINGFIDRAVKHVELAHDWAWLETTEDLATADGTATYSPGATYVRTISCRIAEAAPMLRLTIDEADHWGETNKGIPKAYAIIGRQLRLIPTPNAVLSVKHRFLRTEAALSADASEPLCPEPWIEAVIAWAGALCAERTGDLQQQGGRKAEYDDVIGMLIQRSNEDADTTGGGQAPPAPKE
jgi:hypothetical protein